MDAVQTIERLSPRLICQATSPIYALPKLADVFIARRFTGISRGLGVKTIPKRLSNYAEDDLFAFTCLQHPNAPICYRSYSRTDKHNGWHMLQEWFNPSSPLCPEDNGEPGNIVLAIALGRIADWFLCIVWIEFFGVRGWNNGGGSSEFDCDGLCLQGGKNWLEWGNRWFCMEKCSWANLIEWAWKLGFGEQSAGECYLFNICWSMRMKGFNGTGRLRYLEESFLGNFWNWKLN